METCVSTDDLATRTGVSSCYQCGKCTAGCPVADRMDIVPNQIIRLVQLGFEDRAIRAESIWQCVSCQTCTARCPQSVDCAGVMDALRQLSLVRNAAAPSQQRTVIFQKAFLQNVRRNGRLNELELVGMFKTSAFLADLNLPFLFKNAMLAPELTRRGKLHLNGTRVKDRDVVARIFDRCIDGDGDVRK